MSERNPITLFAPSRETATTSAIQACATWLPELVNAISGVCVVCVWGDMCVVCVCVCVYMCMCVCGVCSVCGHTTVKQYLGGATFQTWEKAFRTPPLVKRPQLHSGHTTPPGLSWQESHDTTGGVCVHMHICIRVSFYSSRERGVVHNNYSNDNNNNDNNHKFGSGQEIYKH